ncbi:MAG: hypothetical protein KJS45_11320 [Bacteroidetes bacterium]|nr:hypothetical protein [Bacteroidota bacterium]
MIKTTSLLIVLMQWTCAWSQSIDIEEAIKRKYIEVTARVNTTPIDGHYVSGFTGECIELQVKNHSSVYREITLQPGQFLMPEDSNEQRMMNTLAYSFKLQPGQTMTERITAFCSQASKGSPSSTKSFKLLNKATGNLLLLAQFIGQHQYKSVDAQEAVWVLTNNHNVNSLLNNGNEESSTLFQFLTTKLNIKPNLQSNSATVNPWIRTVRIRVEYEIGRKSKMRVVVLNEKLEILKVIVDNQVQESGVYTYNNTLRIPIDREITEDQYCIVRYFKDDVQLCERRYKLRRYNE